MLKFQLNLWGYLRICPLFLRLPHIDIETCNSCGGHVKIIACIEDPVVIEKILTHLDSQDASTATARLPPCRAPPQASLFG